jgi:predicted O-methyltransferase YrrM
MEKGGMTFGVIQMSAARQKALARVIGMLRQQEARALEVGSYEGSSALVISHVLGNRGGGSLLCVDPWEPYFLGEPAQGENVKQMDRDLASGDAFDRFKANIAHAHDKAPISFVRSTLKDAGIKGEFDFVFIDGCHRYTEVRQDLETAKPMVSEGGILAGDDLEKQGADVYEDVKNGREQDMYKQCHAGVTCAVWETFGRVFCDSGIWAVRRTKQGWERPC